MRNRIIQFHGADGSRTVVIDGRQHSFMLAAWRGVSAPVVNRTVEVSLAGDAVIAIAAAGDDILLKEKAAGLSGRPGALLNRPPAAARSAVGDLFRDPRTQLHRWRRGAGPARLLQPRRRLYLTLLGALALVALGTRRFPRAA